MKKVKKIEVLQRGQSMVFVKKWRFSIVCVFLQNKAKKMFRDIPDGKECFLDKKSKVLKKFQKIPIFAKGVVYGFHQKMAIFHGLFFFRKMSQKNV